MKTRKVVFLTGATGLVGSYLLKILLKEGHKIYALARNSKNMNATERILDILKFWDEDINSSILKNLHVVEGDLTFANFRFSKKVELDLINEIEIIFHCGALTEVRAPIELSRKINVEGTRNVLDFAIKCKFLKKINYISTTYVAGTSDGISFSEDMLDVGQKFNNNYEKSKFEAEILVNDYIKDLNISIFRPSMILGDSVMGKTPNFKLMFGVLHFLKLNILKSFPADVASLQNLINIDTVAKAISCLGDREQQENYHIVSREHILIGAFLELASKYFKFELPRCIPLTKFDFLALTPVQRALIDPFVPYFNQTRNFLSEKTQSILDDYNFNYVKMDTININRCFNYYSKANLVGKMRQS